MTVVALILGVSVLCVVLLVAVLAWRRLRLLRSGGVDVAVRTRLGSSARGWHLGVGRYRGEEFRWYRVFSLRSGPDEVLDRRSMSIEARRELRHAESYALPAGSVVLRCRRQAAEGGSGTGRSGRRGPVELAMEPSELTGFLSWMEAAPPGPPASYLR